MKHNHLRKDKNCLNCGTTVEERFCTHCGQENTEIKESFRHLLGHFAADITHYDSQLLTTIKDLIFRPGFLTKEYNSGRRASYLNPIRMYIFISAIFFLVAFSKSEENNDKASFVTTGSANVFRQHIADSLREQVKQKKNISTQDKIANNIYTSIATKLDSAAKRKGPASESVSASFTDEGQLVFKLQQDKYRSLNEYDSLQRKLPDTAKDNFFIRRMIRSSIKLGARNGHTGEAVIKQNIDRDIERIMFVLLPLFALYVGFFYSRSKFWYSQHVIFSLHFHSFMFLCLLLANLIGYISPNFTFWLYTMGALSLALLIYLIAALCRVYGGALWLPIVKALAIIVLYLISLGLALLGLIVISFLML